MSVETRSGDPLQRMLAEMRADLDRAVEAELARLRVAPAGPASGLAAQVRGTRPGAAGSIPDRGFQPATAREFGTPGGDETAETANEAGQRLDALARRLEGRLRQSRGRPTEPRPGGDPREPARGAGDEPGRSHARGS